MNRFGLFDFVLEGVTPDQKMAHAARLGYNAVEAMGRTIEPDPAAYLAACERRGVTISCVTGVWLGDGISPDAAKRAAQVAVHRRYLDFAARLGAPRYIFVDHLPTVDTPPELAERLMRETLNQLADHAAERGVTIFIEAIVRKFKPVFATVAETAAFVRELNHPAVRLMVDSYHMAANGEDLAADTAAAWDVVGHVHVSDYQAPPAEPERPYPGDGAVDFESYLRPIVAAGYDGPIIFEGSTVGERDACLVRSREYIAGVLQKLQAPAARKGERV
ncbi:MAG: sugar phosphate isomerase/epimerase [Armatimonadetes bacterium]|nr:sugar phosphate isomerase/epimerase [Armatimonadota bacterium]